MEKTESILQKWLWAPSLTPVWRRASGLAAVRQQAGRQTGRNVQRDQYSRDLYHTALSIIHKILQGSEN